ncbi:DUF2924 domain-containing protein [Thalassovita sp.]|uniref:DUF2924 domain-containing protein n=1 Tax=Thalassovita sp. TaxID=1979401 RepID=UPI0029DE7EF7|nr:DUF2924 domain-containing protein [Thalassovita sp.]
MNRHDPILARLAALKLQPIGELKQQWHDLFDGAPPPFSRRHLEARLAHRIQELAYGGPDKPTRRLLDSLADEVDGIATRKSQITDQRTPVAGTRLVRDWDGIEHTVTVLKDGFDWQGRRYKSLSAVARAITGTRWNGYRFFGLRALKKGGH